MPHSAAQSQSESSRERVELASAIQHERFRLTFGTLLRRGGELVAVAALIVLVIVAADHLLSGGLPRGVIRTVGVLWIVGVVAAAISLIVAVIVRRLNPLFVARHVERTRGIRHNLLLNLLLIERDHRAEYAELAAARQALHGLIEPGEVAPAPRGRRGWGGLFLVSVAIAWLAFALTTSKPLLPSIARMFGSLHTAPTATQIALVKPGSSDVIYLNEPAELAFELRGRSAGQLTFELLGAAQAATPVLTRSLPRTAAAAAPDIRPVLLAGNEVSGVLRYRCRAGDAELTGEIAPQPQPQITDYRVELTAPPYLKIAPVVSTSPEIDAWAGTRAKIDVTANAPMRSPILVHRGASETRVRMSGSAASGRQATAELTLDSSGEYWIEFTDEWGRAARHPDKHAIIVRADRPPELEIVEPDRVAEYDAPIDASAQAWLRVAADDDVRLRGVTLAQEVGGVIRRTELLPDGATSGDPVQLGVAIADLNLKPGETIRAWFEARDNRETFDGRSAAQLTTSRSVQISLPKNTRVAKKDVEAAPPPQGHMVDSGTTVVSRKRTAPGDGSTDGDGAPDGVNDAGGQNNVTTDRPTNSYSESSEGSPAGIPGDSTESSAGASSDGERMPRDGATSDGGESPENHSDSQRDEQGGTGAGNRAPPADAKEFEAELQRFREKHADAIEDARRQLENPDAQRSESPGGGGGAPSERSESPSPPPDDPRDTPPDAAQESNDPSGQPPRENAAQSQPSAASQPSAENRERAGESSPEREREQQAPSEPTNRPGQSDRSSERSDAAPSDSESPSKLPEDSKSDDRAGDKNSENAAPKGNAENANQPSPEQPPNGVTPDSPIDAPADPVNDTAPTDPGASGPADEMGTAQQGPSADGSRVIPTGQAGPSAEPPADATESSAPGGDTANSAAKPEFVNVIDLIERAEEITEDSLVDLPWPSEKKRAFLRDLERLSDIARRAGVLSDIKRFRTQATPGSSALQKNRGVAGGMSAEVGAGAAQADDLSRISPPAEQKVAPALRGILDAYYRSMARKQAHGDAPPKVPSQRE